MIQFDAKALRGLSAGPEQPELPTEAGFYLGSSSGASILVEVSEDGIILGRDGAVLTNPERYAPYERLVPQSRLLGHLDPIQQMKVGSHLMDSIVRIGELDQDIDRGMVKYAKLFRSGFEDAMENWENESK